MKKVKTGIKGLDKLIDGGIPEKSCILISGAPGCGKTILGLQFIYSGAKLNEPGVFVSFAQSEKELMEQAKQFWPDFDKTEGAKLVFINPQLGLAEIFEKIVHYVKTLNAKRLVIDSLTTLTIYAILRRPVRGDAGTLLENLGEIVTANPSDVTTRVVVDALIKGIKDLDCTSLITSELPKESKWLSRDRVSEFAADGVIVLKSSVLGDQLQRTIEVAKMRGTKIDGGSHNLEITDKGLVVK